MKKICIGLIKLYQKAISPFKPPCCRFYPTCSAYAVEAFTKRGFFAGLALTAWRILRCNPLCRAGYDPVPEKGWRNKYPKVPFDRMRERSNDGAAQTPAVEQD